MIRPRSCHTPAAATPPFQAITRAKRHLLIFGKFKALQGNAVWGGVLSHCVLREGGRIDSATALEQLRSKLAEHAIAHSSPTAASLGHKSSLDLQAEALLMSSGASGSDDEEPGDAVMQIEASEELGLPDGEQSPFFGHGGSREEDGACEASEAVECLQQDAAGTSNERGAREVGRHSIVTPSYFAAVLYLLGHGVC